MVEGVNPVASKPSELISNNVQLYLFCWTQGSYKKENKWCENTTLVEYEIGKVRQCNGQLDRGRKLYSYLSNHIKKWPHCIRSYEVKPQSIGLDIDFIQVFSANFIRRFEWSAWNGKFPLGQCFERVKHSTLTVLLKPVLELVEITHKLLLFEAIN